MPSARRSPLTRDRVLRAGMDLADSEGLDAVTMRRLAEQLGVVPMALYKHVADKDDLIAGMVDCLIEDMRVLTAHPAAQWRHTVRDLVGSARRVLAEHPWGRRAIEAQTVRSPAVLGHMERLTQAFLRAGFTPDLTHHVMHLLGNRIWGFSPELFTDADQATPTPTRTRAPRPNPEDYPGIITIATDARARRPDATSCDEDFEFDFALDVILDAIARLRRSGWASPTP